ncbi:MAG: hypothetical protein CL572_01770 [Alphaproteobacteria bacterium]|nr:hypothetical protein [Alphaproteobacteria bacterium]
MTSNFYTEILTLICFLLFLITSFVNINNKEFLNKFVYLSSLLLISIVNLIYYQNISSQSASYLSQITALLLAILLFSYFIISIFYFEFVRLRLIFIPFFIVLVLFRYLTSLGTESNSNTLDLFKNRYLLFHIFSSLFAYSMLTICAISSFSVFIKSFFIKRIKFNPILINLLPSLHQSEILTIRFLYLTMFFLFSSILSGLLFHITEYKYFYSFFNYKVSLSIFSFFLIILFLIYRIIKGCSSFTTFKLVLLSYLFINIAYFGIKIFEL